MANERKLRILIDSSGAKKGGKEVTKQVGKIVASGKHAIKTYQELNKTMKGFEGSNHSRILKRDQKTTKNHEEAVSGLVRATEALIKARQKLENTMYAEQARTQALGEEVGKNSVKIQEQRRLTEELARSKERLNMVNSKEYTDLIRTRKAIEDRNKQIRNMSSDVKRTTTSVVGLQSAFSSLTTVMSGLAVYFSTGAIARTADEYTNITNKLKAVSDATVDTTGATRDLLKLSIDSRSSLQGTMEIYSKMIRVNEDLGKSQAEVRDLTEAVSKSVAMSGASVQGAQGALMQFSQAMSGDFKSSGQELNSILEQTPMLAVAIAKGLRQVTGDAKITTGSLKAMASAGKLSTDLVFNAMLAVLPQLREQFKSTDQTMASAVEGLQSSFTVMLGELDKTYGTSETVVNAMKDLGKTLTENGEAVTVFAASIAGLIGAASLGGLVSILATIGPVILGVVGAISLLSGVIASSYLESSKYTKALDKQIKANKALKESTNDFVESLQGLGSVRILDNIGRINDEITTLKDDIAGLNKEISGMQDPTLVAFNSQGMRQQLEDFRATQSELFKAAEKMEKENNKYFLENDPTYQNIQEQIKLKQEAITIKEKQLDDATKALEGARLRDFELAYSKLDSVITSLNVKSNKALNNYEKDLSNISKAAKAAMEAAREIGKDDVFKSQAQQAIITRGAIDARRIALDNYTKSVPTLLKYLEEEKAKTNSSLESQIKYKETLLEISSIYRSNLKLLKMQFKQGQLTTSEYEKQALSLKNQRQEAEKIAKTSSDTSFSAGIKSAFEDEVDWKGLGQEFSSSIASSLGTALVKGDFSRVFSTAMTFGGQALGSSLGGPLGGALGSAAGSALSSLVNEVTVDFAEIQSKQFTREILGSNSEQTQSLVNALSKIEGLTDKLIGINRGMLDALRDTKNSIANFTTSLMKLNFNYESLGTTDIAYSGSDIPKASLINTSLGTTLGFSGLISGGLGGTIEKIIGGSSKVSDSGVRILGKAFTTMMQDSTIEAYQTIKTRKSWFSSSKTHKYFNDISNAVSSPVEEVLQSIGNTLIASGQALGYTSGEITNLMRNVNIATKEISTKGMDSDQVNKTLSAYFSSVFNTVSENVFSFVKHFQSAGEDFGATLVRVTTNFQTVNEVFSMMGRGGFGRATTSTLAVANYIVDSLGGTEKAASTWENFFNLFAREGEQISYTQNSLINAFRGLGMALPQSREALWDYVKTLNLSSSYDRQRLSLITSLTSSLDEYYNNLSKITNSLEVVNEVFSMMGRGGLGAATDATLSVANSIIDSLGGAEKAASTWKNFFKLFAREGEQISYTQNSLINAFREIGITLPESREALWDYVKTLNLSNNSDRQRLSLITSLTSSLDEYYSNTEETYNRIRDLTDSAFGRIKNWLEEIRGTSEDGYISLRVAQAQFQTQLQLARGGNSDALSTITDYADSVLEAARRSSRTGDQFRLIRDSIVSSVSNIPQFANGGYHSGGLRLVGENGPELEYTGSSNIYNGNQMSEIFDTSNLERSLSSLESSLSASFQRLLELTQGGFAVLARNSKVMSDYMELWDSEGAPVNSTQPIKVEVV